MEKYALLFLCLLLGFVSLKLWTKNISKKRRQKKRFKRGVKLEKQAAKLLATKGFEILDEQVKYNHSYLVNGVKTVSTINIDYLVEKDNKVFVIEVKSGKSAISIKNRSTRRQLLEYAFAINCDGIYLLDMENKQLQLIEFQFPASNKTQNNNLSLVLVVIIVFLLYYIYSF